MFSVKWDYEVDGIARSRVIEADQVNVAYDNRPPDCPAESQKLGVYHVPQRGVVVLGNPHNGAESMALTFGKVYVMNGDGRTVATYTLGPVPEIQQGAAISKAA
jgi:hypothetical protein